MCVRLCFRPIDITSQEETGSPLLVVRKTKLKSSELPMCANRVKPQKLCQTERRGQFVDSILFSVRSKMPLDMFHES